MLAAAAWPFVAAAVVACSPEPAPIVAPPRAAGEAKAASAQATSVIATGEPAPVEQPPACSADRYCWESPTPAATVLSAVWAASERDIYAVGPAGGILHFDGSSWRLEGGAPAGSTTAVWGSGPDDVFVGGQGAVLHRKGGVWKTETLDERSLLNALWGSGPNDVYAVGNEGASFRFDGRQWRALPTGTKASLRAVWGSGPTDVYAVGQDDKGGVALRWDGTSWKALPAVGGWLAGVWGTGPDAVWVAGADEDDALAVWRLAGGSWKWENVPKDGQVEALSGAAGTPVLLGLEWLDEQRGAFGPKAVFTLQLTAGRWTRRDLLVTSPSLGEPSWGLWGEPGGSVLVAGGWGIVARADASGFHTLTGNVAPGKTLTGVWGTSPTDVVAVGAEGALLRYDGKAWMPDPAGAGRSFTAVHGAKDILVASARGGKLLVRKNGQWTPLASGTTKDLLAVWTNGEEIFAGGSEGTILRCAKDRCAPMKTKTEGDVYLLWGKSPKDLHAAATSAELLRLSGATWTRVPGPGERGVRVIDPSAGQGGGEEGVVHLGGIGPAPGGGLLVERTDGSFVVEGSTWRRVGDGRGYALTDGSGGEVRVLCGGMTDGTPTRVRRFDGERWHDEALPLAGFDGAQLRMRAVWSGGGEVFVVGEGGAILHRRP